MPLEISSDQNTVKKFGKTHLFSTEYFGSPCNSCDLIHDPESCGQVPCMSKERTDGQNGFFKLEKLQYKKGIIFVGPAESGKSRKAFEIAKKYKSIILNGREKHVFEHPFVFQIAEKDTELIVIDDLTSIRSIECFFSAINHNPDSGLVVNKKGESKCIIKPLILITLCSDISINEIPNGCSFRDRFDIYEFPYDGEIEFKPL